MNVLSLFDGMSCGQIALNRAGIHYDNYFASEIDKWAIQITQENFPETIQMGDVQWLIAAQLPKIDLLIGGSPCTGFSNAGRGLNFKDPQSKLFLEYVSLLRDLKPKYFLLENVRMKKEWRDIISGFMGVEPILINLALVSAQNRERLYWTNIPGITQPEDKKIYLKDIMESEVDEKYDITEKMKNNLRGATSIKRADEAIRFLNEKARCLGAQGQNISNASATNVAMAYIKIYPDYRIKKDQSKASTLQGGGNSAGDHSGMDVIGMKIVGYAKNIKGRESIRRVYSREGKSPTLTKMEGGHTHPKVAIDDCVFRRLTPLECERLQTMPDGCTSGLSASQRYKMTGNGWTVDVIAHIFKSMEF